MNNLTSLFLSQSYQDTWEDYKRSLTYGTGVRHQCGKLSVNLRENQS